MILGVHHVGMAVEDLDAAVDLYTGMGGRLERRGTSEGEGMQYALVAVGGSELELMHSADPDSAVGKFLARRGPGVHHVAYLVDDLSATVAGLADSGRELAGPVRTGLHGVPVAFVHPRSMGGVLTELVQRT